MTRIMIDRANFRIEAEGHAGQAEKGEDIVCAGISALLQSLLHVLIMEEEDDYIRLEWFMDERTTTIRIHAMPYNWRKEIIRAYFKMAEVGLKAIEKNYGEYVKITKEEQDDGNA